VTPYWTSRDGRHALYLGDCLDVLPGLEPGSVGAVVTDPPYGIGEARRSNGRWSCLARSQDYPIEDWDDKPASHEMIAACLAIGKWHVMFGGNYFHLPPTSCWLVWDKMNGENSFADCELAWTDLPRAVRRIQFRWHGMIRDERGPRLHRTQKPVAVMAWAMGWLPKPNDTILDPFAGSGTTGVACIRTGRRFIGVELEPRYADIAVRRMERELERRPLPGMEPEAEPCDVQPGLFAEATA